MGLYNEYISAMGAERNRLIAGIRHTLAELEKEKYRVADIDLGFPGLETIYEPEDIPEDPQNVMVFATGKPFMYPLWGP